MRTPSEEEELEKLLLGPDYDCPSEHETGFTTSGVLVCLELGCPNARIEELTVPDYETADVLARLWSDRDPVHLGAL